MLELDPHLLGGFKARPTNLYYIVRLLHSSISEKSEGRSQKGQYLIRPSPADYTHQCNCCFYKQPTATEVFIFLKEFGLATILKRMRIDRILIAFSALLLVIVIVFVGSSWLTNVLDIVPTEAPDQLPEWVARLIAGVIAVFSLITATYLIIEERKEAKHVD